MVTNAGVNGVKGIKDVLGGDKISFYPDLERVDKCQLLACNFIIQDVKRIDDWDSEFGTTSFYLVKLSIPEDGGREVTTILGGQAILKQLKKLSDARRFPVAASLAVVKSGRGNEYYTLDNPRQE